MAFLDWDRTAYPRPRLRRPSRAARALTLAQRAAGLDPDIPTPGDLRRDVRSVVVEQPRVRKHNVRRSFLAGTVTQDSFGPIPFPFALNTFGWVIPALTFEDLVVSLYFRDHDTDIPGGDVGGLIFPSADSTTAEYRLSQGEGQIFLEIPVPFPDKYFFFRVNNPSGVNRAAYLYVVLEEILPAPGVGVDGLPPLFTVLT